MAWLELASDARRAVPLLVQEGRHRSAASRAYYAAYSKVAHELVFIAGLPMAAGREGPGHGSLRRIIETSMPNMSQPRRETLSDLIGQLYTLRIHADYHPSVPVEAGESREAASLMNTIYYSF